VRRFGLVAALVAVLAAPAAAHNGGGAAQGYLSTVRTLRPLVPGMFALVMQGDDRLWLSNGSGKEVTVLGYAGEPYLRFDGKRVYRNASSPATYLNEDRFGTQPVPASAKPSATPRWALVANDGTYEWHDHRIHWMGAQPPPVVRRAPRATHHVFDWTVPLRVQDRRVALLGSLDYTPPPGGAGDFPMLTALGIGLGSLAAVSAAGFVVLRRRGRVH
jgi:hypothetical protein